MFAFGCRVDWPLGNFTSKLNDNDKILIINRMEYIFKIGSFSLIIYFAIRSRNALNG